MRIPAHTRALEEVRHRQREAVGEDGKHKGYVDAGLEPEARTSTPLSYADARGMSASDIGAIPTVTASPSRPATNESARATSGRSGTGASPMMLS